MFLDGFAVSALATSASLLLAAVIALLLVIWSIITDSPHGDWSAPVAAIVALLIIIFLGGQGTAWALYQLRVLH